MKNAKYIWMALAAVACAVVLGRAYTYKYRSQDTVVVTGLGETEFSSDLIVWSGAVTAEAQDVAAGYAQIERAKGKVMDFLKEKGLAENAVVFEFVNVDKLYDPVYNANGNWAGQRFRGYMLRQRFTVESNDVERVEAISREISALIAQGVSIEAYAPDYYYTKLDDDRPRGIGTHGRLPDHRSKHQRGILGRRVVQHRLPTQEGPHHHAHRIPGEVTTPENPFFQRQSDKKTHTFLWKDPFGCVSHPAPPGRCTSAASARHCITTSSHASTAAR